MDVKTKRKEDTVFGVGDGWMDLWTLELCALAGSLTRVQEVMIIQGQPRTLWAVSASLPNDCFQVGC